MCFSPKIKTPKVDTNQVRAVDPAPLTEEPKGILFGGDDDNIDNGTSSEVPTGGKKSLKVKLDDSVEKSKKADTAAKNKSKSGIRTSVFKKK